MDALERSVIDLRQKLASEYHDKYVEDTAHGLLSKRVKALEEKLEE